MKWNEFEHTDEENLKWSWLRSIEWGAFPVYLTQPIIPVLIFFIDWKIVIGFIIVINWLWNFVKYKYLNLSISTSVVFFVTFLKWISSLGFGIYFFIQKDYFLCLLCGLYPLWSGIIGRLNISPKIGIIQQKIMNKLGYEKGEDGQFYRLEIMDRIMKSVKNIETNP